MVRENKVPVGLKSDWNLDTQTGVLESEEIVVRGECSTMRLWRRQLLLIHVSGPTG